MSKKWFDLFHPAWARIKGEPERRQLLDSVNACFPLIIFLQRNLLATILGLADARDEFILEALQLLEGGCRASQKGIIYEPSSPNLNVQAIVRGMRSLMAEEEKQSRIPPEFLAESFRIMALFMENYIAGKPDGNSYFQLLRQFHPTVEPPEPESSGIIITG